MTINSIVQSTKYVEICQSLVTGMVFSVAKELLPHKETINGMVAAFEDLEDRRYANMKERNYSIDRLTIEDWEQNRGTSKFLSVTSGSGTKDEE